MSQKELNLGILAHVDAGKTTLTERLLYAAGVIDDVGSVDAGTTQTDSLALEQQRGITIKSAVVSFTVGDVHVNLIDTPGHPDFIAKVERVLSVLDGAVLVISAVEGVQPQTRILMRALERLRIPTLMFVNKIDRTGAGEERVLQLISERLRAAVLPMGTTNELGTRAASFTAHGADDADFVARLTEVLAERDDRILAAYLEDDGGVPYDRLRTELAAQTGLAVVHPVYLGSAITGTGVEELMSGVAELLPAADGDPEGPVSGSVFKVERVSGGEKIAYVRMFSGRIRTRDRVRFGHDGEGKVTAVAVFERGRAVQRPSVGAGAVAKLWGLGDARIGDRIGETGVGATSAQFPPPTLEAVVVPADRDERACVRVVLEQLAEQDPLLNIRQDDRHGEISVSLYGEVQKEVVQAMLMDDFGLDMTFREATPICIERPTATGEAVEILHAESNPFHATIGLRIEPAPIDSGIEFHAQVDHRSVPLFVYKTAESFGVHMDRYVRETLREGLFGWQVTDCSVTLTECGYSVPDGPPSRRGPLSTAADYRKLTPIVVMQALERAATVVCEPIVLVRLEIPADTVGAVVSLVTRLGAALAASATRGQLTTLETMLPAARASDLQRQIPGLTHGEGVVEMEFGGASASVGPSRRDDGPHRTPSTGANT